MQRIHNQKVPLISTFFKQLFLEPSQTPEYIQEIAVVVEILVFFAVTFKLIGRQTLLSISPTPVFLLCCLLICIALKFLFTLTIVRAVYIPFTIWVTLLAKEAESINPLHICIFVLIFINLAIDVISRVQFDIKSINPHSETINQCKPMHYLAFSTLSILFCNQDSLAPWVESLAGFFVFAILVVMKSRSISRSFCMKTILVRFYALCFFCYIRNMIREFWISDAPLLVDYILIFALSQGIFNIIDSRYKSIELETEISDGKIVELSFKVLSYYYSSDFDQSCEILLKTLASRQVKVEQEEEKESLHSIPAQTDFEPESSLFGMEIQPNVKIQIPQKLGQTEAEAPKCPFGNSNILRKTIAQIKTVKSTEKAFSNNIRKSISELLRDHQRQIESASKTFPKLLQAQLIYNIEKSPIKAHTKLIETRESCNRFDIMENICIWKLEQNILNEIARSYKATKPHKYEQFIENEKLRNKMVKNSYEFLALWENMVQAEVNFHKIEKNLDKVIKNIGKVDKCYQEQVPLRCVSMVASYTQYLYQVRKDVKKANRVCRDFNLFREKQHVFEHQKKLYISIHLSEQNILMIDNIGYNVKKLLGYDKADLRGANTSILLPEFYRKYHETVIKSMILSLSTQEFAFFKKDVIARHKDGYYIPAMVELKLVYNVDGDLLMEGFIEVKSDPRYIWTNFFFAKYKQEEIVEVGPDLQDIVELSTGKMVQISEYFENQYPNEDKPSTAKTIKTTNSNAATHKKYMLMDGEVSEYDLILNIDMRNEGVYRFYVRQKPPKQPRATNFIALSVMAGFTDPQILTSYLKMPLRQTNISSFSEARQQLQRKIDKPKMKLIMALSFLFLFISVGMKTLNLIMAEQRMQYRSKLRQDLESLVYYNDNLSSLAMECIKMQYVKKLNYSIPISNITSQILVVQETNNHLTKYSDFLFGKTVNRSAIYFPKPLSRFIRAYVSNAFSLSYVDDDDLRDKTFANMHTYEQVIFGEADHKYIDGYQAFLQGQKLSQDLYFYLIMGIKFCFILIAAVLVFVVEKMVRVEIYQTLLTFTSLDSNTTRALISSVQLYLESATGGANLNDMQQIFSDKEILLRTSKSVPLEDKMEQTIPFSSRESSRAFLDDDLSIDESKKETTTVKEKKTLKVDTLYNQEQKRRARMEEETKRKARTKKISKKFMVFWISVTIAAIAIPGIYNINWKLNNYISLHSSLESLLHIYRNYIGFSNTAISYCGGILYQDQMLDTFQTNIQRYGSLPDNNFAFEEIAMDDFKDFADIYQKYNYAYLCEFNACDPTYREYMNIIFTTTIDKANTFMKNNLGQNVITSDNFELRALLEIHAISRDVVTAVVLSYLNGLGAFDKKKQKMGTILHRFQFVILGLWACCLAYYYMVGVGRVKKLNRQIMGLVKNQSYKSVD